MMDGWASSREKAENDTRGLRYLFTLRYVCTSINRLRIRRAYYETAVLEKTAVWTSCLDPG